MTDIHFGTDGWRDVIAERFTFDNVRRVARAMGVAVRTLEPPAGIDRNTLIVGYDRRFLSRRFAESVAEELADLGIHVLLSSAPTPSQTVSHAVKERALIGGVIVTASHNPAEYNGLKFKAWYGGSAVPSIYEAIENAIDAPAPSTGKGTVGEADILTTYLAALQDNIELETIRGADLHILHDPIHGAAAGLPERILGDSARVTTIRGDYNPSFGSVNPEPIPENLAAPQTMMRYGIYSLAICNDGDADRLGILDERGHFVTPHQILSLLALDMIRRKGMTGEIVKTFSTTRLLERIGQALGVTVHETAIGFKYVADLMLERDILIGGEESGGVGFGDFLPERDGILSGLRVAECVAANRKSLSVLIEEMEREFGPSRFARRDIRTSMERAGELIEEVRRGDHDSRFGSDFSARENKDGCKLVYGDGTWILFRKSGTEPLIRIYCESGDRARVDDCLARAAELLK